MAGLADIIAAGPAGGDELVEKYLGVPKGYKAYPGADAGDAGNIITNLGVTPKYAEGAQFEPGGQSPEDVARLQQLLDRSGLYQKSDTYRLGVWDDNSVTAYTRLLYFANQQGYDADVALKRIGELTPEEYDQLYGKGAWARSSKTGLKQVGGPGSAADVDPGSITQGLSADDLRYLADRTARKSLGRKLNEDELNRFSGAYSQMLSDANARKASAQQAAAGGTNVTYAGATSADVFAEQQAQKLDPTAFEARRQVGALRAIGGMLGQMGGT